MIVVGWISVGNLEVDSVSAERFTGVWEFSLWPGSREILASWHHATVAPQHHEAARQLIGERVSSNTRTNLREAICLTIHRVLSKSRNSAQTVKMAQNKQGKMVCRKFLFVWKTLDVGC